MRRTEYEAGGLSSVVSPQGSVLVPIFFLISVNHVTSAASFEFKCYADDLKLYLGVQSRATREILLGTHICQKDINLPSSTVESWGLSISVSKCSFQFILSKECSDSYG